MNAEQHAHPRTAANATESVIGGLFGRERIAAPDDVPGALFDDFAGDADVVYTATGRGGILLVCRSAAPRTVWFPSYLCPSMVRGVSREFEVRFYDVGADFRADRSFLADVSSEDVVCVLDYFGRPAEPGLIRSVRASGAVLLEDATQSWMSDSVGAESDFVVVSLMKTLGVPAGGVVFGRRKGILPPPDSLPPASNDWWTAASEAWERRGAYDAGPATPAARATWYELYNSAALCTPEVPAAMNPLTLHVLGRGFDVDAIVRRRIDNHRLLFDAVGHLALLKEPESGVVPFGFVCCFETNELRDRVRKQLVEALIFPAIHWTLTTTVPAEFESAHDLSRRILTIPCDQRYDGTDMGRIIHVLKRAMR